MANNVVPFQPKARYQANIAKQNNYLGRKIAEARKAAHFTQKMLAEKLEQYGVSVQPPAVNKWENGDSIPNGYQLIALCYVLGIQNGLEFFTGHIPPTPSKLNSQGAALLDKFIDLLENSNRYAAASELIAYEEEETEIPVFNEGASAGTGDYLTNGDYELVSFPARTVPPGANFAIRVNGDSMEPVYHNGQIVFVQECESLHNGEVGIFILNGEGYIKIYRESEPNEGELEESGDRDGFVHIQVHLCSYNKQYEPRIIKSSDEFFIKGRILN
ncbi:MAG: helix-turn-helix domain-containing protein [Clostridia bacterium]|nr:helix-turn-helix domain-containing protein [Clostridia bacterium]